MKWIQVSQEVYSSVTEIVSVESEDIVFLKQQVKNCPNNRVRICAHPNSQNNLHEMLIVIAKGSYIRPHKHLSKSESFHIIEGMLDVVIFDDDGNIIKVIAMGDAHSGKSFFYRLSEPYFHTLILKSELVVFHETTNGPFNKDDTIYASWAPERIAQDESNHFIDNLVIQANSYTV